MHQEKQTHGQTNKHIDRQTNLWTDKQTYRQTNKLMDRQTNIKKDKQM